jgi:HlyD family secretion protein
MTAKRWIPIVSLGGLAAAALMLATGMTHRSATEEVPVATAAVRDLRVTVRAVGELDAVRATTVHSALKGSESKIVWIVEEGTWVEKGDRLVTFDPTEFEKRAAALDDKVSELEARVDAESQILAWERHQVDEEIKAKEFELKTARIDLRKLEKGDGPLELEQLKETFAESESAYERFRSFMQELEGYRRDGIVEESDASQAQKRLVELKKKYQSARQKYHSYRDYMLPSNLEKARAGVARAGIALEQARKGGGFRIGKALAAYRLAEQELKNTRKKLAKARADLDKTVLLAPIPGLVVLSQGFHAGEKRKARIGDQIIGMQPLVYLPDISKMMVRTRVREIDLHKIAVGKPAVVSVDAYPELQLKGVVGAIGVLATASTPETSREKTFSVTVLLEQEEKRLRPGMTAHVEILCRELKTLCVPIQAVFREDRDTYCYTVRGRGFEKRRVTLGIASDFLVQVETGLAADEQVALSDPGRLQ